MNHFDEPLDSFEQAPANTEFQNPALRVCPKISITGGLS